MKRQNPYGMGGGVGLFLITVQRSRVHTKSAHLSQSSFHLACMVGSSVAVSLTSRFTFPGGQRLMHLGMNSSPQNLAQGLTHSKSQIIEIQHSTGTISSVCLTCSPSPITHPSWRSLLPIAAFPTLYLNPDHTMRSQPVWHLSPRRL